MAFAAAENVGEILVSGEYDLTVNTANLVKAVAITSGQSGTGNLNVTGNLVKGSAVTTSANADSITTTAKAAGGAGDFVTYNAGAGNDAISSTIDAINNASASFASVKIDGGAGTDTLTITDAGGFTAVDANFQYLTNIEAISYTVANQAVNVTTGGFFDTNFKAAGAKLTLGDATNAQANSVDLTTFTGNATIALNAAAATTAAQTIKTGAGADTVSLTASGLTTGGFTVATGAGNDTIAVTVTTALDTTVSTINGGAGKDAITLSGVVAADTALVSIVVNAGQSTLTAFDSVTGAGLGVTLGQAGTLLNFDGSAVAAANVTSGAVTGYTSGELTYTVTNGLLTFSGSGAAALNAATKATIAQTVITAANATVAFVDGSDTYVFHNDTAGDSLVQLVGVTGLGLGAGAVTTGYVNVG